MSSDSDEFYDAEETSLQSPSNNNVPETTTPTTDLPQCELLRVDDNASRRRRLQNVRSSLQSETKSVNEVVLEETKLSNAEETNVILHEPFQHISISSNEPDLIQSVKSSSLKRQQQEMEESRMREQDATLASVSCVSAVTELDQSAADRAAMPPPPVAPPRRHKVTTKGPALSTAHRSAAPTISITASDPPVLSDPPNRRQTLAPTDNLQHFLAAKACLLTAPSPLLPRRSLNLDTWGGEEAGDADTIHVTADEHESTRGVNDLMFELSDRGSEDTESIPESSISTSYGDSRDSATLTPCAEQVEKLRAAQRRSYSLPGGDNQALPDQQPSYALNLDTGELVPLTEAESQVHPAVNPLSLHIMRRTQEYSSSLKRTKEGGDGAEGEENPTISEVKKRPKKKKRFRKLIGKAASKIKSVADEVFHHGESSASEDGGEEPDESRRMIRIKAANSHKGPYDFDLLVPVQDINQGHSGAVWAMKFSPCGRLLATGGQDNLLKVWVVKEHYDFFNDMRIKYSTTAGWRLMSLGPRDYVENSPASKPATSDSPVGSVSTSTSDECSSASKADEDSYAPFMSSAFCVYTSHTADILDISWSKNFFILTSSMDKTVRLWHVSRKECLCCFQHIDFVTAISFHPKDDRYFLSGSLDGKLRLWNIPDKRVSQWNEVTGNVKLITAANFCMSGKFAVVGTYDGRCLFYSTDQMKYYTQIHVRSTRGRNAKGRKITGIEPFPGEDKILVTSNDSRIRLYDLRDLNLTCKYKGYTNNSSQIRACFSHDGRFLVAGSEDQFMYIWRTQHDFQLFSSGRRDRSDYWEAIKAHTAVVTCAVFAPKPNVIIHAQFEYLDSEDRQSTPEVRGEVLVSSDYNGHIKVFINKFKPGSG